MVVGKALQALGAFVEELEKQIKQTINEADKPEIRLEIAIKTLGISADMLQKARDKLNEKRDTEELKELEAIIKGTHDLQERTKTFKERLFPTGEK